MARARRAASPTDARISEDALTVPSGPNIRFLNQAERVASRTGYAGFTPFSTRARKTPVNTAENHVRISKKQLTHLSLSGP